MIARSNYLKIRQHLKYLEEVLQLAPASLARYRFYLRHLLLWADERDFSASHLIRPTLPAYIASLPGRDAQGTLAPASQKKILDSSKRFFCWARSTYLKDFSKLPASFLDTLRLPRHSHSSGENVFVSLPEVRQLIALPVPEGDLALLREQAAAAMLYLSGMRASAFTTLPISGVDLEHLALRQWPETGVHTKNSKRATTFLLNIPDLLEALKRWDALVRNALPAAGPWYAPVVSRWGEQRISTAEPGKNRVQGLHKRLKHLFDLAGLEFKSAHKFRHGHAVYGLLHAGSMADYKAVSMNLMHESIEITDSVYAPMLSSDVQQRINSLSGAKTSPPEGSLEAYLGQLSRDGMKRALVSIAERLTA